MTYCLGMQQWNLLISYSAVASGNQSIPLHKLTSRSWLIVLSCMLAFMSVRLKWISWYWDFRKQVSWKWSVNIHRSFSHFFLRVQANCLQVGPSKYYELYSLCHQCVTADDIMALFEKKIFSEAGTNELKREQATYMMLKDLLEELEGITILNFIMLKLFSHSPSYLTPWTLTCILLLSCSPPQLLTSWLLLCSWCVGE